jgi:transcriptional regulator with XRE-family HTH domain
MENEPMKKTKHYDDTVMDKKIVDICLNIKKARIQAGISQKELAERINRKRNAISRIESEGGNITLKTLFDIIERGLKGKIKISIQIKGKEISDSTTDK